MKICYLANASSIHTVRWARHFADRGHEIDVISFQVGKIEGIRVANLTNEISVSRWTVVKLLPMVRRLARKIRPDILHAHYVTSYGLAGALTGIHPFIATAWGDDVLIDPERSLLYRLMVRWALARADLVTSMAHHMTMLMNQRGYAVPDKILTLPFGVDTQRFNLIRRTRRHDNDNVIVISTRHLVEEYDVQTLVRAIPRIISKCPTVRFLIVGEGDLRSTLERLAVTMGVRQYVEFYGRVSQEEMPNLLGEAEIFVTTAISDGNNISLVEGMACGSFPVASDIPANREWIDHGVNGLIFPVGDANSLAEAIIQAAQKPEWRKEAMNRNWDIVSQRGSWASSMSLMEDHYHRLCGIQR